ncbi:toprim domain-containing protein [bacterium]|nr:toprim domain-containing protein [bacterium]
MKAEKLPLDGASFPAYALRPKPSVSAWKMSKLSSKRITNQGAVISHETSAQPRKISTARASNTAPESHQEHEITMKPCRTYQAETLDLLRPRLSDYLVNIGVELRQSGTRLVGKCPNHDDQSPSFAVYGTRHEMCGCFPCCFTGDVFALSQWLGRSSTFREAVQDVAATLGVYLPQSSVGAGNVTLPVPLTAKQPTPPFVLSAGDHAKVHATRFAFSEAFHSGEEIVDRIGASLGLDREKLRLASWGSSGLGLAAGSYGKPVWLCYSYPQGLKWRNPDPTAKPRFEWLCGKALAPWRIEWVKPDTRTVYITEGESDCLALIAAGVEDDGTAVCVASPGTSFPREWAPLFTGKRVVLCFDTDPPGKIATVTVAAILRGHASEILTWKGTASHE